jgi:hypothetical protein
MLNGHRDCDEMQAKDKVDQCLCGAGTHRKKLALTAQDRIGNIAPMRTGTEQSIPSPTGKVRESAR